MQAILIAVGVEKQHAAYLFFFSRQLYVYLAKYQAHIFFESFGCEGTPSTQYHITLVKKRHLKEKEQDPTSGSSTTTATNNNNSSNDNDKKKKKKKK